MTIDPCSVPDRLSEYHTMFLARPNSFDLDQKSILSPDTVMEISFDLLSFERPSPFRVIMPLDDIVMVSRGTVVIAIAIAFVSFPFAILSRGKRGRQPIRYIKPNSLQYAMKPHQKGGPTRQDQNSKGKKITPYTNYPVNLSNCQSGSDFSIDNDSEIENMTHYHQDSSFMAAWAY